jgi:hypothetical protein
LLELIFYVISPHKESNELYDSYPEKNYHEINRFNNLLNNQNDYKDKESVSSHSDAHKIVKKAIEAYFITLIKRRL